MPWNIESFKSGFGTGRALWNSVIKYSQKQQSVGSSDNNTTNNSNPGQLQNEEENDP